MSPLPNITCLIIDDDPVQRTIIADDLQQLGLPIPLLARSGEEALQILRESPVDLIFCDLCMPEMDGPQFLRHLGSTEYPCKKIILISSAAGDIQSSVAELGRLQGIEVLGQITKPTTPENLARIIWQHPEPNRKYQAACTGTSRPDRDTLVNALQTRQILPWYQPKLDCRNLEVTGVEALARWHDHAGNPIPPSAFVSEIENQGLATDLFFCMLEQVLSDMAAWKAKGYQFKTSVNISMSCTFDPQLPEKISARLQQHAIAADKLMLEVTESQLMGDNPLALETLNMLSLQGIQLSIDDFGTGYSSLVQIARLPFNELKIEGCFVRDAGKNNKADAILKGTLALGHSLGMSVTAEGVERSEQLELLRLWNTNTVQGYLFARPMPAATFSEWVQNWRPGRQPGSESGKKFNFLIVAEQLATAEQIWMPLKRILRDGQACMVTNKAAALTQAKEKVIDGLIVCSEQDFPCEFWQELRAAHPSMRIAATRPPVDDRSYCHFSLPLHDQSITQIARHLSGQEHGL